MFWLGLVVGTGLGVTLNMLVLGVIAWTIVRQDQLNMNKSQSGWGD